MRCAIQESKMSANQQSFEFRTAAKPGQPLAGDPTLQLLVSLNVQAGAFEFEWLHASSAETAACGRLATFCALLDEQRHYFMSMWRRLSSRRHSGLELAPCWFPNREWIG